MLIHLNHQRFSRLIGLVMVALTTLLFPFPAVALADGRPPAHRIGGHGPHAVHGHFRGAHAGPRHLPLHRPAPRVRAHGVHGGNHPVRPARGFHRGGLGAPHFIRTGHHHGPIRRGSFRGRPPVGAILASLPLGFLTLAVGSSFYYHHGDVFFRPVATGYLVVDPPRAVARQATPAPPPVRSDDQVVVTAPRLNVRSGPGRSYEVISVIDQGTALEVAGSAPDWLYVDLGDGRFGWVQQTYTASLFASVNG
ncbi:MAG: SH3 domain-containing protein [Desulfobacterales bacterium]|nr:SH3 domain-containing protein [Desulfobacterales bacterium]